MLSASSTKRGKTERETAKCMADKKVWKGPAQEYIEDIQVIDVFFAG